MMREVPVRDTDPDPFTSMNNNQEEDRSSPVAFTVDFGKTKGSSEDKSRKLERFVHKSSQRRTMSPLQSPQPHHTVRQREQYVRSEKKPVRRQNSRDLQSFSQELRKDGGEEEDDCDDYVKFESESDKSPSETGTYTVDKDDNTASPPSLQEPRLSSLVSNKTSYVEEWATKHAFPVSRNVQQECFANPSRSPDGTKSSLNSNKSRRLLPATPQIENRPGDSLQFSPSSDQSYSLTPPNLQESEEESSYVSHTQHLVEVMEERIKQKNLKKFEVKPTRSLVTGNVAGKKESKSVAGKKLTKTAAKNTVKSPEPHQEAMEAWKRRKNYNPMAAAGRKRVSETRKQEMVGGQEDTSEGESVTRQTRSAPTSAKTRGRPNNSSTPLRRLAQTNSSSSLQGKSNRSTSSLTSKEAEFQAWKRRKDYDPRKAAARPSSSRKVSTASSTASARRQNKVSELSSSNMTKSLIIEELNSETPIQRSNSFHSNAKLKPGKTGRHHSEEESEDDCGSGYDSSLAESQLRSYPHRHYYLDDDELILPLQSSHVNTSQRSLYNRSPQVSPNKSRSGSKLEALDSLVISTIHNVSNKLCSSSAAVLRQAALVFPEQDEDKASTLETVIYLLEDLDLPPSPAKKTSRELSGTLRNLKKIEQSMEMMKKLLEADADEEEDE